MSNQRLRIVLVGAGGYGRLYVETMTQRDYGADLTAICDIDPHLADRIPIIRKQSIPVYPSLEAFFANDTADLAVLVSPVHFHTDMVLLCLAHGLNVLCEKPLCLTTQEAETMRTAAQKAGRFLSIGYQIDYRTQAHCRLPRFPPRRKLLRPQRLGRAHHLPWARSL